MQQDQNAIAQGVQNWVTNASPDQASGGFNVSSHLGAQQTLPAPTTPSSGNFFAHIGHSIASAVDAVPKIASAVGHAALATGEGVINFGKAVVNVADNHYNDVLQANMQQSNDNLASTKALIARYRAGDVSPADFQSQMSDIASSNKDVSSSVQAVTDATGPQATKQIAIDAAYTALLPFTALRGAELSVEEGGTALTRLLARSPTLYKGAEAVQSVAFKFPGLQKAILSTPEGTTLTRTIFNVALKNPIQLNLGVHIPVQIMTEAADGKYGQAAIGAGLIGLMPFVGGPLGAAFRWGGKLIGKAGLATYGKAGFVDELDNVLSGNLLRHMTELQSSDPALYTENLKTLKFFEQQNLNQFAGNAREAVNTIVEWQAKHSNPITNYTDNPQGLLNYWKDFRDSFSQVHDLGARGLLTIDGEKITDENLSRVGIGKFGTDEKYALVNALKEVPEQADRIKLVNELIADGYGWAQNPNMREAITAAVSGSNFEKDILGIKTGTSVEVAGGAKFPRNYFPIFLSPTAKGYDSQLLDNMSKITHADQVSDVLDRSVAPKAIAGSVGNFFSRIGLSPQDQNATAYIALRRNIAQQLIRQDVSFGADIRKGATNADYILRELGNVADAKKSVFDLRQLTASEVQSALKVDASTARRIRAAITQGYMDIPLQVRGLGNAIQDVNSKLNPFAKMYSRVQSAGRYAFNPFFVLRENIKSESAAQALVGGKAPVIPGTKFLLNIFGGKKQQYDDLIIKLDKGGFFARGSGRDEFADSGLVGISAHLHPNQKMTAATMVTALARKAGMSTDDYLKENAAKVSDLIRWSVQYPKNHVLNSPLVTTLNLVAFPARFNIKVATIAARALSQQSALNQVLVLNSLMNFGQWLGSDEGQQWQVRNTEALGVLKYFTPLESFSTISKILTGKADSVNDYGQLGGLPFGVISMILQHQGVMPTGQPYINPRTGEPLPDYIPKTTKARAKSALDDLLSSVFSYPGATIGLGSKTTLVSDVTSKALPVKNSDKTQFTANNPTLNAESLQQQAQIRQANGLPTTTDAKNPFQGFNIPPPEQLKPLITPPEHLSRSNPPAFASVIPKGPKPKKTAQPIPTN